MPDDDESTNETFGVIPTISHNLPLERVLALAKGYEDSGMPFVVTGIPIDATRGAVAETSMEWLDHLCQVHGTAPNALALNNPFAEFASCSL